MQSTRAAAQSSGRWRGAAAGMAAINDALAKVLAAKDERSRLKAKYEFEQAQLDAKEQRIQEQITEIKEQVPDISPAGARAYAEGKPLPPSDQALMDTYTADQAEQRKTAQEERTFAKKYPTAKDEGLTAFSPEISLLEGTMSAPSRAAFSEAMTSKYVPEPSAPPSLSPPPLSAPRPSTPVVGMGASPLAIGGAGGLMRPPSSGGMAAGLSRPELSFPAQTPMAEVSALPPVPQTPLKREVAQIALTEGLDTRGKARDAETKRKTELLTQREKELAVADAERKAARQPVLDARDDALYNTDYATKKTALLKAQRDFENSTKDFPEKAEFLKRIQDDAEGAEEFARYLAGTYASDPMIANEIKRMAAPLRDFVVAGTERKERDIQKVLDALPANTTPDTRAGIEAQLRADAKGYKLSDTAVGIEGKQPDPWEVSTFKAAYGDDWQPKLRESMDLETAIKRARARGDAAGESDAERLLNIQIAGIREAGKKAGLSDTEIELHVIKRYGGSDPFVEGRFGKKFELQQAGAQNAAEDQGIAVEKDIAFRTFRLLLGDGIVAEDPYTNNPDLRFRFTPVQGLTEDGREKLIQKYEAAARVIGYSRPNVQEFAQVLGMDAGDMEARLQRNGIPPYIPPLSKASGTSGAGTDTSKDNKDNSRLPTQGGAGQANRNATKNDTTTQDTEEQKPVDRALIGKFSTEDAFETALLSATSVEELERVVSQIPDKAAWRKRAVERAILKDTNLRRVRR